MYPSRKAKLLYIINQDNQFFRELGVLVENLKKSDKFDVIEDGYFNTVGVMIDASRCAVATVATMKNMLDRLALMGYSMAMLYTQDTVEVPEYPFLDICAGDTQKRKYRKWTTTLMNTA